jgi:hypothetical protein
MEKYLQILVRPLLASAFFLCMSPSFSQDKRAIEIIEAGMQQMGGEEFLSSINSLQTEGKQVYFLIDQSIRPTGPFFTSVNNYKSLKLPQKNKLAYWNFYGQAKQGVKYVVDGEVFGLQRGKEVGFMPYGSDIDEELYLAPEKVLFLARDGTPVFLKDTLVQDVSFSIVSFKWRNYPVRLFFSSQSHYLSLVEITRHYTDNTAFILGDTKTVHRYSFWKTTGKQLHYPAQKDTYIEGQHFQSFSIDSVFINQPVGEDSLTIPDSAKTRITKITGRVNMFANVPLLSSKEIIPGIFFIGGKNTAVGNYNSWFIKTSGGVIVIEAPVTSAYSKGVMNEVKKQFPGEKIKAIITTSDAWPHFGGLREYVANKIPVYLLGLNEKVINRLLLANYYTNPDSLQKNKTKPVFNKVDNKVMIGDKDNPIELYPVNTESGERMMMIYFPKHKLLYSSDLVQPGQGEKFFMPQYIGEIIEAINREKLQVEKIIGMHQPLIEYKELLEFMK